MLLAACAGPIAVNGPGAPPPGVGSSGFMVAAPPVGEGPAGASARAAVAAALIERGFSAESDARHRVEVAFAIAPTAVSIAELENGDAGDRTWPAFALCKRQRFVLSIAMIDRRDGVIVFRNRASASRCGEASEELLGALARAAVQGSLGGG